YAKAFCEHILVAYSTVSRRVVPYSPELVATGAIGPKPVENHLSSPTVRLYKQTYSWGRLPAARSERGKARPGVSRHCCCEKERRMDFGMFTDFHIRPHRSQAEAFVESFSQVEAAEKLGMDSVWLAEHHFSPERSVLASPLVIASAIAAQTSRIRIGLAVQ